MQGWRCHGGGEADCFQDDSARFESTNPCRSSPLRILDPKVNFSEVDTAVLSSSGDLSSISELLACYAMEQLEAYRNNLADYRMTEDFMDELACAYMMEKIPVSLSYAQASVLLCIGLQGKDISRIEIFQYIH